MSEAKSHTSPRRWILYGAAFVLSVALVLAALFVINGTLLANGDAPVAFETQHAAAIDGDSRQIKVLAYNIAKCFVYDHDGDKSFASRDEVVARLGGIVETIRREQPELVFLSEAVVEFGPCNVNQVEYLAEATQMHSWAFGENYCFGLPWFRAHGGNAILSRWPLQVEGNPSLAGRQAFYVTKNNRRVLWCRVTIGGEETLLGAIHTDSFNGDNNLRQTRQILDYCGERPSILAGDFNANPDEPSIDAIRASQLFAGEFNPAKTFPAKKPVQTLDYIFAPHTWRLIEHRVLTGTESDHLAVVSTFALPDQDANGQDLGVDIPAETID